MLQLSIMDQKLNYITLRSTTGSHELFSSLYLLLLKKNTAFFLPQKYQILAASITLVSI